MSIARSLLALLLLIWTIDPADAATTPASQTANEAGLAVPANEALARLPFLANAGRFDEAVAYVAPLPSGRLFVTHDGRLVYSLQVSPSTTGSGSGRLVLEERAVTVVPARVRGVQPASLKVSRFDADTGTGQSRIDAQQRVALGEAWPGVSIEVVARDGNVEKLFQVAAEADPSRIAMTFAGVSSLAVTASGRLRAETQAGPLEFSAPIAWQTIDGRRHAVPVDYRLLDDASGTPRYGFALGDYDRHHALTIDPVLEATTLGGSAVGDSITGVVRRSSDGAVYVTGTTPSHDFPIVSPAYDESLNTPVSGTTANAFIARFSADLSTLEAATFLGSRVEHPRISLSGSTVNFAAVTYADFPVTPGAYAETSGGGLREFVLARLSADLDSLLASTYLGGNANETRPTPPQVHSNIIAGTTTVCIAGNTSSSDYPTTAGAFDTSFNGGTDGVLSCLDGNLSTLTASTFFGATSLTTGVLDMVKISSGIALGGYVVGGFTQAAISGMGTGGYDSSHNGVTDGIVLRFNSNLTSMVGTYLGSPQVDRVRRVYYDSGLDSVFVASETNNNSFAFPITAGAFDTSHNGVVDIAISRLSSDLSTLQASTYLGGSGGDWPSSLARDANGKVVLVGHGHSTDFPVTFGAFATQKVDTGSDPFDRQDAYIARLDPDLTTLEYGSYFGLVGQRVDEIDDLIYIDMATDTGSGVYFPQRVGLATAGSFQQTPGETTLVHLDLDAALPNAALAPDTELFVGENTGQITLSVARTGDVDTYSFVHWVVDFPYDADASDIGPVTEGTLFWGSGDNNPKTIFLDIIDDARVEGNERFRVSLTGSVGATLSLVGGLSRDVRIVNDDTAGFELSPLSLSLNEESPGNEGSFSIRLTSQPSDPVPVMLTSNDANVVFLPAETSQLLIGFDDTDWDQPQNIGIRVLDDDFDNDRMAAIGSQPVSSADGTYSGLTVPPLTVNISDDDMAGLAFANSQYITYESDGGLTFRAIHFALGSEPTADVTVQFAIPAGSVDEGVLLPASEMVVIPAADWDVTQEVFVAGVDDAIADGNQLYGLQWSVSSSDPDYDGLTGNQPFIVNVDDELPQVDLAINLVPADPSAPVEGETRNFGVVVQNVGGTAASPADVASGYSSAIPVQSWSCLPVVACTPSSGSGNIATKVTLGVGEIANIGLVADIVGPPGGSAMLDVYVIPDNSEVDSNPNNNVDNYTATVISANPDIFADGFE
ncbi:MAG: Calx-beta domain-containing protein [Lysobacteraceae bacterium]